MSEQSFRGLCEKHARVSCSLSKFEVLDAHKLVEVWKSFLQSRAQACLEECSGSNVLMEYSLDLTPIRGRHFLAGSSVRQGTRSVLMTHELLVQWLQVNIDSGGITEHHFITRDPLPMTRGKTTAALVSAAQGFLASSGCFGVSESVVCFHQIHDRGVSVKLKQCLSGYVRKLSGGSAEDGSDSSGSEVFQLHTHAGCCLHDLHNSVRWGWQVTYPRSEDTLKEMYVGISSFRASMAHVAENIGCWLEDVLVGVEDSVTVPEDCLREFYATLGARSDLLDRVCCEMKLVWEPTESKLCVRQPFLTTKGSLQGVIDVLMEMWQFPVFTTSRWLSVGSSSRHFLLGVCTGYMSFFHHMRNRGVLSEFECSAGAQLTARHVTFAAVLGLLSYPADAATGILLADARLVVVKSEVEQSLEDETMFVEQISQHVWRRLASYGDVAWQVLRDRVLSGVYCTRAYFFQQSLEHLEQLPWSLMLGDVAANLASLLSSDTPPPDVCSSRIWALGRAGMSGSDVIK
eukprot:6487493-Amphidinium_carterae.1